MRKLVIFTDLDGTLLDADDYSFEAARPALTLIAKLGIPLVLTSSKTRAEIEKLRIRLGNCHPFISENGGGIFIPPGYFSAPAEAVYTGTRTIGGYETVLLGSPYAEIRAQFTELRAQLNSTVRGFGDMSAAEVAALTGLPEVDAVLAKQRDFDEPFVFSGATDENFLRAIESRRLHWTQGRIFHILSKHDKGRAVRILIARFCNEFGAIASIGLGDGYNDLPMLAAVDQAVLIRHKDGGYDTRIDLPGLGKARLPGPAGWNEAVLHLLAAGTSR